MVATANHGGLKILMLHGFTQSGRLFDAKSKALAKAITKAFPSSTLHYPTGPIALSPSDIPGFTPSQHETPEGTIESFAWWRKKEEISPPLYQGIELGLQRLAETIERDGPFDGVIGFSQGACAAPMVTSLLEPGRKEAFEEATRKDPLKMQYPTSFINDNGEPLQKPLKFAVFYSGFAAPLERYSSFYEPKISTPTLHVIGSLDTVVEEARPRFLASLCEGGSERIVVHPGGHFVPSQRQWLEVVVGYIRSCVQENSSSKKDDEKAEDMDVPF